MPPVDPMRRDQVESFIDGMPLGLVLCFLVATLIFVVGCTSTQKGAGIGGVLGAGTGALIGRQTGQTKAGLAIGAGLGALTGGLMGHAVKQEPVHITPTHTIEIVPGHVPPGHRKHHKHQHSDNAESLPYVREHDLDDWEP